MKKEPLGATPFCVTGLYATRPDATWRGSIIFHRAKPLYQGMSRALERMLTMLLRLKDLRQGAVAG
jgi:hypothetical protein